MSADASRRLVGFVGLGSISRAIVSRLLGKSIDCTCVADELASGNFHGSGATPAPSAAVVVRSADIVFLDISEAIRRGATLSGPGGLKEALSPGKVVVLLSEDGPEDVAAAGEELAVTGAIVLDAAHAGDAGALGTDAAPVLLSGPEAGCSIVSATLAAAGVSVDVCGNKVGAARMLNVLDTTLFAGCMMATFEGIALGRKMNLSLATMTEAINAGSGRNFTSSVILPAMIAGDSCEPAPVSGLLKCLRSFTSIGTVAGAPTIFASLTRSLVTNGVRRYGGSATIPHLLHLVESMADSGNDSPAGVIRAVKQ